MTHFKTHRHQINHIDVGKVRTKVAMEMGRWTMFSMEVWGCLGVVVQNSRFLLCTLFVTSEISIDFLSFTSLPRG